MAETGMTIFSFSALVSVLAASVVGLLADNSAPYPRFYSERREPFPESFSYALQLVDVRAARFAEPLKHKPSRFLCNAYLFTQLERRDALTGRYEQIHRVNPLVEWNVRPLKDRAGSHREIQRASVTAIEAVLSDGNTFTALASGTDHAIRPEAGFKVEPRRLLVRDEFKQLKGRYGAFAHRPNLANLC